LTLAPWELLQKALHQVFTAIGLSLYKAPIVRANNSLAGASVAWIPTSGDLISSPSTWGVPVRDFRWLSTMFSIL